MPEDNLEIQVRLFGVLREKLSPDDHGQAVLKVPEGTTVADVLASFDISGHFHVSVNEDMVEDWQTPLKDGDEVDVFRPSAGGTEIADFGLRISDDDAPNPKSQIPNPKSHGWQGSVLHVNLTSGELQIEEPPEEFYRFYMGGSAMGMHYVLKHTPPHADPLGPDNTLALAVGVVTGAAVSGQSRVTAVAKSPLTGAIGDSQSGGFWPAELKFAGFDAIIIYGASEHPVYLWVHDGQAELRDAGHLWGRLTGEVEKTLQQELEDERIEVLQCGPAGENGVRFAAMISMSNRANGRTGMGAVMGSKMLKAIVVRGKEKPNIADPAALKKLARWGAKNFSDSDVFGLGKYGTAEVVMPQNKAGGLPTYNWSSGYFPDAEAISGEEMYDTILRGAPEGKQDRLGRDTCYACTVRCKRVVDIQDGDMPVDHFYGGPEYETLSTFGSYCGVEDLNAIAYANQLCNQYGMDTISCGATIAWAFDCFEQGLITAEDTGGLELGFGNAGAMVELTEMIARREGFGDVLACGSAQAAELIGRGTEALVVTTKKQEMPAHMPQVKRSLGLIYAVNPFGADHQSSEHDGAYEGDFEWYKERLALLGLTEPQEKYSLTPEKVRYALITEYLYSCLDSVSVCQFVYGPSWHLYGPDQLQELVQNVTGWDVTIEELLLVGERRLNMLRVFNAREGFTREDDKLPKKLAKALKGGHSDGFSFSPQELETAKDTYYELAGWDVQTGTPTAEKLDQLGLSWLVEK
ncbi:MAG: aldehyde ferredoxin oxidoreductase C-terminal domain-containing protein [Candidatus Promineifilaceae bacterium]|jgi:aldehyde:ferredoxin oxidoreductase